MDDTGAFLVIIFKQVSVSSDILVEPKDLFVMSFSKHVFIHNLFLSNFIESKTQVVHFSSEDSNLLIRLTRLNGIIMILCFEIGVRVEIIARKNSLKLILHFKVLHLTLLQLDPEVSKLLDLV